MNRSESQGTLRQLRQGRSSLLRARLSRLLAAWSVRKPRAPPSTVPIPHDAADELHFDDFLFDLGAGAHTPAPLSSSLELHFGDFLFDFPTHHPSTTFYTTRDGSHECVCVVVNKVFARERARLLHEHRYLGIMCVTLGPTTRVFYPN